MSDGKSLSQPACQRKWKKCTVKKRINSNINVMYACVSVYIRCGIAVLFTCTSVLSQPTSKEEWTWNLIRWNKQQDTGYAKTNKKNAHEIGWQRPQFNLRSRPWRTYSRGAPRRWPFKYVQDYDYIDMRKKKMSWAVCSILSVISYDYSMIHNSTCNTDWCLFFAG